MATKNIALTKADVKLLQDERSRLRAWNKKYGQELPMAAAMNRARIRDIGELLK